MCGIVGLYLKKPELESQLGKLFEPMLQAMTDRGPDSAGFAIYGDEVADGWVKLTLQASDAGYPWAELMGALEARLGCSLDWFQNASAAVPAVNNAAMIAPSHFSGAGMSALGAGCACANLSSNTSASCSCIFRMCSALKSVIPAPPAGSDRAGLSARKTARRLPRRAGSPRPCPASRSGR